MEIVAIIVGGLVVMTGLASFFSYLTEKRKRASPELDARLVAIESKLREIEQRAVEKDSRVELISEDLAFTRRLVEEKLPSRPNGSGGARPADQ